MEIITIDFETYYDKEYSLSKMTTEAYIRDPRFEVIGVGVKVNKEPTIWYSGTNVKGFLTGLDYSDKAILCHHTAFDGAILSWHFGIKPKLWLDTLSMARPFHNMTVGGSLKALATHYEIGAKGDEVDRVDERLDRLCTGATDEVVGVTILDLTPQFLVFDDHARVHLQERVESAIEEVDLLRVSLVDAGQVLVDQLLAGLDVGLLGAGLLQLLEFGLGVLLTLLQVLLALTDQQFAILELFLLEHRHVVVALVLVHARHQQYKVDSTRVIGRCGRVMTGRIPHLTPRKGR